MNRKPSRSQKPARGGKSQGTPSKSSDSHRAPTLESLRAEVDRLDQQLVTLLNRRTEITSRIGSIKHLQGLEVWSAAREDEVVSKAIAANQGPLPEETLRAIFRELLSGSRSLQRTIRVACLGPKYSYSHLAAVAKFGEAVEHVPVGSIAAVFEEVNRRHVEFGLVPLENSTDGRIADTLEMFVKLPNLKIRAEVRLGPSLPAGQLRVESSETGLFQVSSHLAVSQLAGEEPAPSGQGRGRLDGRRR